MIRKKFEKDDIVFHYQYGYGTIQAIVGSTVEVPIKCNNHYFDKEDLVLCDTRYLDLL